MKAIPYGRQSVTQEDINAVVEVLNSDFLTQGPAVENFEKKFSQFVGCKYAVAVTNGTAALHLAAMALNVGSGDKVLCTTNSFVASANCVRYCGGEIEFVDIDAKNFCIDIDLLEKKLRSSPPKTYKGIVAVDFAGYPVDFERIQKIALEFGLWVIEDACHALGANFIDSKGIKQHSGNGVYADIAVFSFHPVKHIATGEGGMVTTNNPAIYEKLKLLRTHGITKDPSLMSQSDGGWYYEMQELGFNFRISDILCALGSSQLTRIETNLARRREIALAYEKGLEGLEITPLIEKNKEHGYHLYVIQTPRRKELYEYLKARNIFTQVHYIPIHVQPYYKNRYGEQSLNVAESYYSQALSLPMYHSMSDDDLNFVINSIREF
ncbi:MAG: UDP-4-amino-4,6-dideoxy-N-acetyl-beta-L-altrosamine transaminase [Bacteriovorax sp.]|nr:UDP-4-amino-4,6-dideoxy-N-acetyl-beta-L-altrosamine transaminase [Bacteriovorax sp.]